MYTRDVPGKIEVYDRDIDVIYRVDFFDDECGDRIARLVHAAVMRVTEYDEDGNEFSRSSIPADVTAAYEYWEQNKAYIIRSL